jgi:hypothetical protein
VFPLDTTAARTSFRCSRFIISSCGVLEWGSLVVIAKRAKNDELSSVRDERTISNLREVKARSGIVTALATEGDEEIKEAADRVFICAASVRRVVTILKIVQLNCSRIRLPSTVIATWITQGTNSVTVEESLLLAELSAISFRRPALRIMLLS